MVWEKWKRVAPSEMSPCTSECLEGVFKRVRVKECCDQMCIFEISFAPQCEG